MASPSQSFGAPDTNLKLKKLAEYLDRFNTALQFQPSRQKPFKRIYFDAFAGNGGIDIQGSALPLFNVFESGQFIKGSARRALELRIPFDEYVFVEKSKQRAAELEQMVITDYPSLNSRVKVIVGDANRALQLFCISTDWHTVGVQQARAVVFLDPFGNNVEWTTIESLAATRAVDLWYLFPAGWGVNRQIRNHDGEVHHTHVESLNRLFGCEDWKHLTRRETGQLSLLDDAKPDYHKIASPKLMTEFMIERMKQRFKGGVLDDWLPLGALGRHDYSLIFAWANPSPKAKLAATLAAAVLKSKKSGRS